MMLHSLLWMLVVRCIRLLHVASSLGSHSILKADREGLVTI